MPKPKSQQWTVATLDCTAKSVWSLKQRRLHGALGQREEWLGAVPPIAESGGSKDDGEAPFPVCLLVGNTIT